MNIGSFEVKCFGRARRLRTIERDTRDDLFQNRAPAFPSHASSSTVKLVFSDEIKHVTLAKRRPIKTIRFVQEDLHFISLAGRPFCRTQKHVDEVAPRDTVWVRDDNGGMRSGRRKIKHPHFPAIHHSSIWRELALAVRASSVLCSGPYKCNSE